MHEANGRTERSGSTSWALLFTSLQIAGGFVSCQGSSIPLGTDPDLLFWNNHEGGESGAWAADGHISAALSGDSSIQAGIAHSGSHSLRCTVRTLGKGTVETSVGELKSSPNDAYYSAWFYIPEKVQSPYYWVFFKFRGRHEASDPSTDVETWDLNISSPVGSTEMGSFLWHHEDGTTIAPLVSRPIPLARWFQIEARLQARDVDGRLTIWQDGEVIYEFAGHTAPGPYIEWLVGSISEELSPSAATLYVDDAAVSKRRLGPSFSFADATE